MLVSDISGYKIQEKYILLQGVWLQSKRFLAYNHLAIQPKILAIQPENSGCIARIFRLYFITHEFLKDKQFCKELSSWSYIALPSFIVRDQIANSLWLYSQKFLATSYSSPFDIGWFYKLKSSFIIAILPEISG